MSKGDLHFVFLNSKRFINFFSTLKCRNALAFDCIQGTNARKGISEVHAFCVLQCTVFGRKSKHKTFVTAWHGIHFHKNNLWNYYLNYLNYQNLMLLTSSDTKRTLMHLFLFTNSVQRELVSIYTQSISYCN